MRVPVIDWPNQSCGGMTISSTVGRIGLSSWYSMAACWAYSSTAWFSWSRFSWSGPPTCEYCCLAFSWNANLRIAFMICIGSVFTMALAVRSPANCCDVPSTVAALWSDVGAAANDVVAEVDAVSRRVTPSSADSAAFCSGATGFPDAFATPFRPTAESACDTAAVAAATGAPSVATGTATCARGALLTGASSVATAACTFEGFCAAVTVGVVATFLIVGFASGSDVLPASVAFFAADGFSASALSAGRFDDFFPGFTAPGRLTPLSFFGLSASALSPSPLAAVSPFA
jgi:hypothetical protein